MRNVGLSAGQYRAARAMLGWSLIEASRRASVSVSAIVGTERGLPALFADDRGWAVRTSYEASGIVFTGSNDAERGLTLRPVPASSRPDSSSSGR